MKFIAVLFIILSIMGASLCAQSTTVRLKDIGKLIESRDNQLIGYGIVVGLRGTGDSRAAGLTNNALRNLLSKMGVSISGINLNARNAASVIVTTDLPSFIKKGQRVSVTVSALGDASSLIGGTLIMTPMVGPDMQTYAVAQGNIVVEGINEISSSSQLYKNQATVGSIPNGAIVEAEIPVTFTDQHNITIVLDKPSFYTVSKAMKAIQENGYKGAKAIDGNTIKIPLEDLTNLDLISAISEIENIEITPDSSSKIVLNSKTGTIIIGERVKLFPVAITHGGMSIKINNDTGGLFGNQEDAITISEDQNPLIYLEAADTLSNLVNSLNQIGVSPKELISIIQALKESGALVAELEIL
ncbi:flagellar biosynthesis protein FlgA [bacterium]|nr:flagellar biosynthesis protein FlgA [bacterium]